MFEFGCEFKAWAVGETGAPVSKGLSMPPEYVTTDPASIIARIIATVEKNRFRGMEHGDLC